MCPSISRKTGVFKTIGAWRHATTSSCDSSILQFSIGLELDAAFWVGCTFMHKCWTQRPFVCHCCILGDEPKQKISTRLSSATKKKAVTGRCLEICIYIKMANLSNMHIWITKKISQIGHPKHVTNLNQLGIYMLSHILISSLGKDEEEKMLMHFGTVHLGLHRTTIIFCSLYKSLVPWEKNTFRRFQKNRWYIHRTTARYQKIPSKRQVPAFIIFSSGRWTVHA